LKRAGGPGDEGVTIFVLDANRAARAEIAGCLRRRNHRVEEFGTIAGLEQALERREPDLLILEARLPDGDGFQLVEGLKKRACVPVVFVSCRSSCPERIRGLAAGADDYVGKPFSARELALRAEAILKRYRR